MSDFDPLTEFSVCQTPCGLVLTCDECGTIICDIEDGDVLNQLANSADEHWWEKHA